MRSNPFRPQQVGNRIATGRPVILHKGRITETVFGDQFAKINYTGEEVTLPVWTGVPKVGEIAYVVSDGQHTGLICRTVQSDGHVHGSILTLTQTDAIVSTPHIFLEPRPSNAATGGWIRFGGAGAFGDVDLRNYQGVLQVNDAPYNAGTIYEATGFASGAMTTSGFIIKSLAIPAEDYGRRLIIEAWALISSITTSAYFDFNLRVNGTDVAFHRVYAAQVPGTHHVNYMTGLAAGDGATIDLIADPNANGSFAIGGSGGADGRFNKLQVCVIRTNS